MPFTMPFAILPNLAASTCSRGTTAFAVPVALVVVVVVPKIPGVALGGSIACCKEGVGIIAEEAGLIPESGDAFIFIGDGAYIDE